MWIGAALLLISFASPLLCRIEGWESLGCWRDLPTRAIASLEGKSSLLGENWKKRVNPLNACAEAAKEDNLKVFAVQDGGQCFGGPYAHVFYSQYGPSNLCKGGLGGVWSNSVYSSKTAYTRVLESKKENEKLVKCSKPLDMVFLVDGSGDDNVENKLRWDQMLKFVTKATEHFDSPSTRFGVILYGSQPKTIVNINDNKDQTTMRDSIISAKFPGGPRTINEALKKAWKEQLKYAEHGRNKVIVTLATGSMDYGPWGSSLFLTNRGVRLLSFGIDRGPSYRYLETISSGKHPENIYSIDSEQLDELLPFFAKDVCTGFKKSKIETVRKDNEIDLISTQDFETVGSVVERKSTKKESKISQVNLKNEDNIDSVVKAVQLKDAKNEKEERANGRDSKSEHKNDEEFIGNKSRERQTENTSLRSDDVNKTLSIGSNDNDDNRVNEHKEKKIFPVNNSSLSDGEIVEKLKESAVEVLKNAENVPQWTNFSTGEPLVKENPREAGAADKKFTTSSDQGASSNNDSLTNSGTGISTHNNENINSVENTTTEGGNWKYQSENSLGESYTTDQSISLRYNKRNSSKSKNISNGTLNNDMLGNSLNERVNSSGKEIEGKRKPWTSESAGQMLEGKNAEESHENFGDDVKSEFTTSPNTASNRNNSTKSPSSVIPEENRNSTTSFKKQNSEIHSSFEEHYNKEIRTDDEKDVDNEIFDKLQQQRESIGQEEKENQDEDASSEVKSVDSLGKNKEEETSEDSFGKENVPDDEFSIDEDERATQNALEQKRREIDVLLKKLDETRRRRKRRKVRQGLKNFGDDDAVEDFEENENDANFRRRKERNNAESKNENGMETGDENSLMPTDSVGLNSHKEGGTKSLFSGIQNEFSEKGKWNKYIDTFIKDDGKKYNNMQKGTEKAIKNIGKQEPSGEGIKKATRRAESSMHGLKKIVEEVSKSSNKKGDDEVNQNEVNQNEVNQNDKEAKMHLNDKRKVKEIEVKNAEIKVEHKSNTSSGSKTSQMNRGAEFQGLSQSSSNFETEPKYSDKKGEGKEASSENVWVFKPDTAAESGREQAVSHTGAKINNIDKTGDGKTNASLHSREKGGGIQSLSKEEMVSSEGSLLTKINEELGCTRPVAVLYALDVSDAIGTGPTRQRKWNHMKRFLRSVNDKVIHGGTMGYIVYDTEPRLLSNLEPCDEKTEYFVTSGECLCDHSSAFFHKGKSSCSTHAPTEDESIEDWGKQGPRTAKALNFAEKIFANKSLGDTKKLVVLVTHEASTDDVTGAERSLKENSISLVDIEIGERHNINKRSNRFDDLIPRDHQMEVSFYKLDKAIENIFTKVCKEKDPTKTRRSRIFATLRKHKHWW